MVSGKETLAFYNNSGRTIQSMLCGAQYVTPELKYKLAYMLRLVCIYSPNHKLVKQDTPHLNNTIYDKRLMKSYHGADADDDSDQLI